MEIQKVLLGSLDWEQELRPENWKKKAELILFNGDVTVIDDRLLYHLQESDINSNLNYFYIYFNIAFLLYCFLIQQIKSKFLHAFRVAPVIQTWFRYLIIKINLLWSSEYVIKYTNRIVNCKS